MMRFFQFILFLQLVFLVSCGERRQLADEGNGVALSFKYATLLDVADFDGYRRVVVRNPWDSSSVLQTYVLVDR
ncbi:MAG: ABC transporter substrate-binding protein, partial [Paludibacteraceae bacterium]|nr:ABC transporter substrate-binding protein [Paludibacteraceae bacterium]